MHRPLTGRLVIATHNPGKLARCATCSRPTASRRCRRANWAGRARGDRHDFRGERPHQGGSGRAGVRLAGLRRQFRARGRCARRRARHLLGALGRRDKDFRRAMQQVEDGLRERDAVTPAQRKAHFVSALCVAWPDGHVEEFEGGRRHAGLAAARRRRFRLRSDVPARRLRPYFRRDDRATRSTACRRGPRACRIAPAPSSSSRRPALAALAPFPRRRLRRLHPLAVLPVEVPVLRLQQPRAPRRNRRGALRARVRRGDRDDRARAPGRTVSTIFFGGGTPSLMQPATVGAILDTIGRHWTRRARRRGHAGGQSRPASRRRAFAAIARPASIASRSACRRSTTRR